MTVAELRAILDRHHPEDDVQVRQGRRYLDVEDHSTYGYQKNGQPQEVLTLEANFYGEETGAVSGRLARA